MTYKLKWIGTGSGFNAELGNTSFTIEGRDKYLVDCGFTVTPKLLQQGKLAEIDNIAITHLHSDHIGGLEILGFFNKYVLDKKPTIYVATENMAENLWNSLKGGMGTLSESTPRRPSTIDDYFDVKIGKKIGNSGMEFTPADHGQGMENYGIVIKDKMFYSGDTVDLPPHNYDLIFQDCQLFQGGIHTTYDQLKELPEEVKAKLNLVHIGSGYEKQDPQKDGFAGFVMPGDEFEF